MALVVGRDITTGVPKTFLPGGLRPSGIGDHWTAGGTGRAGADATVRHFITTAIAVNASYHLLTWWERPTLFARWIVEPEGAAHSVNPRLAFVHSTDPARRTREATRFAETRRILGADADDPNAGMIARSFCGMPADLVKALADPGFIEAYTELTRQLMAQFPTLLERPLFGHGWIQPSNRFEMDGTPGGIDLLIAEIYERLASPAEEDDMRINTPIVTEEWFTKTGPASTFTRDDGSPGHFTARERVKAIADLTLANGKPGKILDYGTKHEALVIPRSGLARAIPGTRVVGSPTQSGITPEQLAEAELAAFGRGATKATTAYTAAGVPAAKAVKPT